MSAWRGGYGRYNGRGNTPCFLCPHPIHPNSDVYRRRLPPQPKYWQRRWQTAHAACAVRAGLRGPHP